MKVDAHPEYHNATQVVCSCGNMFTVGSTKGGTIHIELCDKCHPFYTGTQKFVDKASRIERFQKKMAAAQPRVAKKYEQKRDDSRPLTLREMLANVRK